MMLNGDGWELSIEQRTASAWAMSEPDPNWEQEDESGHLHSYDTRGETWDDLQIGEYWCSDCHEFHEEIETVCLECGADVHPGSRTPDGPTVIKMGVTVRGEVTSWVDGFERLWEAGDEPLESFTLGLVKLKQVMVTQRETDVFDERSVRIMATEYETLEQPPGR